MSPSRAALALLLLFALSAALHTQNTAESTPAQQSAQEALPDPLRLLESVLANQKQVEAVVKDYVFVRTVEEEQLAKDGTVKEREVKVYESFMVGSRQVDRLVSVNGVPLDEKKRRKEEERAQKRAREHKKAEAKAAEKAAKKSTRDDDKDEDVRISDVLRATRIFNARREAFDGRSVVAYDFEPAPGFKPKGREQSIAHKLAGTIWIDDQAKQVARLEARLVDGFKIGGFLASVSEGMAVVFEQKRINDEVWLPSLMKANGAYRVLFSRKNIRITTRFSDYRKFRVEHSITGVQEVPPRN